MVLQQQPQTTPKQQPAAAAERGMQQAGRPLQQKQQRGQLTLHPLQPLLLLLLLLLVLLRPKPPPPRLLLLLLLLLCQRLISAICLWCMQLTSAEHRAPFSSCGMALLTQRCGPLPRSGLKARVRWCW
jgi:hypothetical protein